MTTDTQLAPKDPEIAALRSEFGITSNGRGIKEFTQVRDFARAVLDKWGQPAHSGEPVGYLYCGGSYGDELADWEIVAEQLQCDRLNEHHGALWKEAKLPLYTAPQPVEREPLTPEQIKDEASYHGFIGSTDQLVKFVRSIEAAHGIKGGQHGTNN